MADSIAILDFGSQYTQLIARCLRELHVYCEMFPWDTPAENLLAFQPKGFILSGGPASVYQAGAPFLPDYILASDMPVLGICYGMQLLADKLGGNVLSTDHHEYGSAQIQVTNINPLLPQGKHKVWMSHGDHISQAPEGFIPLASSSQSPIAAMGNLQKKWFGMQFHPEVVHTPRGKEFLKNFVVEICHLKQTWTADSILALSTKQIQQQVGNQRALVALSGGVDSSVATALVNLAIPSQLEAVFVDNGLLRRGESEQVQATFRPLLKEKFHFVDAASTFLNNLKGIVDPELKRKVIGKTFIEVFEQQADLLGNIPFLVQGTIYPDVVESQSPERSKGDRIKTHHNVGGLPSQMKFKLVEPLRFLFKDEVRAVGLAIGLSREIVWRQPFPGPGLAVRCLGEVTRERLEILRNADAIFISELSRAGLLNNPNAETDKQIAQAFAVLLPVRSVGVMGDQRTYQEVIALRAVTSQDFMTAGWAPIPHKLLARIANRIVNEVGGVNRIVYDITSKPPATIEWE